MCMGGSPSTPAAPPPPPQPEPVKKPNQWFTANQRKQYMAAGFPGTNATGGMGVTAPATTTANKTLLGV